jgi:CheY-like chemotaxis protein
MPLTELFRETFIDISHDTDASLLHVNWNGYQSVDSIRQGSEKVLELMQKHNTYIVLNDNTHVLGIWRDAAEWLARDWFPRMKQAGLKRFAWVYSPSRFSQVSTDATLSLMNGEAFGVKTFYEKAEAVAWLGRNGAKLQSSEKLRMRVLVIEDNKDFSHLFREMLKIMGCDPEVASTARSGLELAQKISPDMIFCDIGLPGDMDGFDFAALIRSDEKLARTPLIAVSGYTSPEDKQRAVDAGFDRVFPKPVKFADITEALNTFSKEKSSGR